MAGPSEPRRLCSWWWDSHISPKNSKWLQENLTEIDSKVKGMIKIINEDADSFARRAEMYYKKRPELMKLVEEFYRAYRALAERYDNATGELRMAHKTISEVFPNQIPPLLSDDTPSPNPHLVRAFFDPDVLCRDSDSGLSRKGLKQLNEMFQIGEGETESLKEALAKMEAEKDLILVKYKQSIAEVNSVQSEVITLKETLLMSESEKQEALASYEQSMEKMFVLEGKLLLAEETAKQLNEEVNIAENEIKMLNEKLSELNAEKGDSDLLYQQCLESISVLQSELVGEKDEIRRLKSEILLGSAKLRGVEDVCALFEKMNESLRIEGDDLVQKIAEKDEILFQKHTELEKFMSRLGDEESRFAQVQETLNSLQNLYCRSQEEQRDLALELKNGVLMLKNLELEIQHLKEENRGLNELNLASCMTKTDMENEIMSLKEMKEKFEAEANKQEEQNEHLQRQVHHLKEETENLLKKYHDLLCQVESAGIDPKCASSSIKDLRDKYSSLKETCNSLSKEKLSLVDEKSALFSQLQTITETMKGQLEKNALMENSLQCANVELEGLRVKSKSLEDMCRFLSNDKSNLDSERSRLIENSQVEMFVLQKFIQDMEEKNMMKNVEMEFLVEQFYRDVVKGKEENEQLQIQNTVLSAVISELRLKGIELEERKRVIDNGFFLLNQNYAVLEHNNDQLLEVNKCLKNRLSEVEEENHSLVEESSAAIVEALCFSNQSVVYKSLCAEKAMELEISSEEIQHLREAYTESENETKVLIQRLEEKNQKLNVFNHQLNQKSVELFSAEQRIAAIEDVNTELHSTIEGLDEIHGGLEQRITELTEYKQHQEMEIVSLREANERLESDLDVLNEEIEACKIREVILSSELHERSCEFQLWEAEASSFYFDLQSSGIREALYEDKAYELGELCDDLEDVSSRRCVEIEMMKDRISFLESESDGLKTELAAYFPAIASLKNNIVSLEKNPVLQTKLTSPQQVQRISVSERSGLSELHDMQSRIETIESAMKEIEEVKSSSTSNEVTGPEFVNGTRMKDIPLDYISEVSSYSNRRKGSDKLDKMLELWETDEVGPTEIDKNVIELNTMTKRKIILERLCSDAQKLERVRVTVEELKRKIEGEKEAEYERVRSQVQDIEDSAVQFAGLNTELTRAIRESDEVIEVEEARKEGEKIGRLEVDVKKVQKMLIKLEGEKGTKKKKTTRGWEKGFSKRSIVIRELFVGSGRKRIGKKKVRFCGCMP